MFISAVFGILVSFKTIGFHWQGKNRFSASVYIGLAVIWRFLSRFLGHPDGLQRSLGWKVLFSGDFTSCSLTAMANDESPLPAAIGREQKLVWDQHSWPLTQYLGGVWIRERFRCS